MNYSLLDAFDSFDDTDAFAMNSNVAAMVDAPFSTQSKGSKNNKAQRKHTHTHT